MMYNPKTDKYEVESDKLKALGGDLLHILASIRKIHDLPLHPYRPNDGLLNEVDHLMINIIKVGRQLGITLGGKRGHEIDLSEFIEENN